MPVTPKDRLKNPLRKLRLILGDGNGPVHQDDLAKKIHYSVASIRSIEGGRRSLSENCLWHVWLWLGARWDQSQHQWVFSGTELIGVAAVKSLGEQSLEQFLDDELSCQEWL